MAKRFTTITINDGEQHIRGSVTWDDAAPGKVDHTAAFQWEFDPAVSYTDAIIQEMTLLTARAHNLLHDIKTA